MDSTPTPIPHPDTQPLSLQSSARKLPIKRKTPDPTTTLNPIFLTPKSESTVTATDDEGGATTLDFDTKPPPFKFHRIWTEPDEIRFLQGLIDCSSQGLSFPRDLHIFYSRFSNTMSQPYTKSQLSEKLRRLRKKFRVISSRLARGLDQSLLSPHDRALFELSKKLWSPEFSSTSPFGNSNNNSKTAGSGSNSNSSGKKIESKLVGVKVSFSPTLPLGSCSNENHDEFVIVDNDDNDNDDGDDHVDDDGDGGVDDVKMSEVNVDYDFGGQEEKLCGGSDSLGSGGLGGSDGLGSGGLGGVAAKSVMNVFDQSLKEVRTVLVRQGLLHPDSKSNEGGSASSKEGKDTDFERRWREQRVAELDVLARRLRLVLEKSLNGQ